MIGLCKATVDLKCWIQHFDQKKVNWEVTLKNLLHAEVPK